MGLLDSASSVDDRLSRVMRRPAGDRLEADRAKLRLSRGFPVGLA
jgi:hypothetical protein